MDRGRRERELLPDLRERGNRFSDRYHWSRGDGRRTTISVSGERGIREVRMENRDHRHHHHHRSNSKDSVNGFKEEVKMKHRSRHDNPTQQLTERASSHVNYFKPRHSSNGGGMNGNHRNRSPKKYTATNVFGLRYKFRSDRNEKFDEKTEDEESGTEVQTKGQWNGSLDFNPWPSLASNSPTKRKNTEPEQVEMVKRRLAVIPEDTVDLPVSSEECKSSEDSDLDLVNLQDIQTKEVVEPNGAAGDDDDGEDLDILIIDLSDAERAEMESWAK